MVSLADNRVFEAPVLSIARDSVSVAYSASQLPVDQRKTTIDGAGWIVREKIRSVKQRPILACR